VHVDQPVVPDVVRTPDVLENLSPGEDASWGSGQQEQQVELER
jgi:hypothetical protein